MRLHSEITSHCLGWANEVTGFPLPLPNRRPGCWGRVLSVAIGLAIVGLFPRLGSALAPLNPWTQEAKIASNLVTTGDQLFGQSVSLQGTRAAIGARYDDQLGLNAGAAYIYELQGGAWQSVSKLLAADGETLDNFGNSISLSGNQVLVGAWAEDPSGLDFAGSAYVFAKDGANWHQTQKLVASDAHVNSGFGESVAINGDWAIVGADKEDSVTPNSGAAYIFRNTNGQWSQQAKLKAAVPVSGFFGAAVAIQNQRAVVGAWRENDRGAVYVFDLVNDQWQQTVRLTPPDLALNDFFGNSVSLDGDRILVGSPNDTNADGTGAGSAYIFELSNGSWQFSSKLTTGTPAAGSDFGWSVDLEGDRAVVGAINSDIAGNNAGAGFVFDLKFGVWEKTSMLTASDAGPGDHLGESISLSGNRVFFGAPIDETNGIVRTGAVYSFVTVPEPSAAALIIGAAVGFTSVGSRVRRSQRRPTDC